MVRSVFLVFVLFCSVVLAQSDDLQIEASDVGTNTGYIFYTKPSPTTKYLPFLQKTLGIPPGVLPNPIGVSLIYNYSKEKYKITSFRGELGDAFSSLDGDGGLKEWGISDGRVVVETHAIGGKADVFLLPFLQVFVLGAYLNVNQTTSVGETTLPLEVQLGPNTYPVNVKIPIPDIQNKLEGFSILSGINIPFAYKGFFISAMVAAGYARLDDKVNDTPKFVEKNVMYYSGRIGYNYRFLNIYTGVQSVVLFGETEGKDLSKITQGLVKSYAVNIKKFPVNFLAGIQLVITRELMILAEYTGSPDVNGVNIEIAARF